MKTKLSYQDQIKHLWRKAYKDKDAAALLYYERAATYHACVSYETFVKSWAGEEWLKKEKDNITALQLKYFP